jgi:hypothetical protein
MHLNLKFVVFLLISSGYAITLIDVDVNGPPIEFKPDVTIKLTPKPIKTPTVKLTFKPSIKKRTAKPTSKPTIKKRIAKSTVTPTKPKISAVPTHHVLKSPTIGKDKTSVPTTVKSKHPTTQPKVQISTLKPIIADRTKQPNVQTGTLKPIIVDTISSNPTRELINIDTLKPIIASKSTVLKCLLKKHHSQHHSEFQSTL